MKYGWFRPPHSLLTVSHTSDGKIDFTEARDIVNAGRDQAPLIKKYADRLLKVSCKPGIAKAKKEHWISTLSK